jgi:hypothetical protein
MANRLSLESEAIKWDELLAWMEEWKLFFGRRRILAQEAQLGLWGELLIMAHATEPDRLFAAWRGPDCDPRDFLCDGKALEVKVSKRRFAHFVSQAQVDPSPAAIHSFVISLWGSLDPVRGVSLPELVESLISRLSDSAALLRQLSRVGYSHSDRLEYSTRFSLLEPPSWFRIEDIPRVRVADSGVSNLRYMVTLDAASSLDSLAERALWHHFCGIEHLPTNVRAILT